MIPITQQDPIYNVFMKVIKKHWKFHLINRSSNVANSLAIGNPGFAKTSGNRREAELRYELNHKLFMIYDAGRMDLSYMMFPSVSNFWKVPKLERGKIILPKSYKVELLYPITSNIPKKLPYNAVPFTIGVNDLDENDITALVGAYSKDTVKGALNYMKSKVKNSTTPLDYLNIMGSALKKVDDFDNIKPSHFGIKKLKSDVLLPMINEGLLTSSISDTTLNTREKIKDNKTISILVLRHCPQQLWGFLVYYFLNHIFKVLAGFGEERKVKQKTTVVMNEVADLLSKDDDVGSSSGSISKMIGKIAKQYRTGEMFLLMDTQIPQELPDIKDTLSRIYVYNSGIAEVQKAMEIIGISNRSGQINQDDMMVIPRLPRGYFYLFDRNTGVSIHKSMWTRSRTWLEGDDFYDVYDKVCGKSSYVSIKHILDKLETERKDNENLWKEVKKIKTPKIKVAEFDEEIDNPEVYEEKKEQEVRKVETPILKEVKIKSKKKKEEEDEEAITREIRALKAASEI